MTFSTGCKPDPMHVRRRNAIVGARRLSSRLGVNTTAPKTLEVFTPPVMDQGETSSCTGHAWACAVFTALFAHGTVLPFVPSPGGIYTLERCLERGAFTVPLDDEGAAIGDGGLAVSSWGVLPIQAPTNDGRYSDVDETNVNLEPKFIDLEKDATTLLVGAHPITSYDDQLVEDIMVSLNANAPIVLAVPGGSAEFQNYSGGVLGPINAPLDHAVCLIAGDPINDKYRIRNSWGKVFGAHGDVIVNSAFLRRSTGDRYAASVRLA